MLSSRGSARAACSPLAVYALGATLLLFRSAKLRSVAEEAAAAAEHRPCAQLAAPSPFAYSGRDQLAALMQAQPPAAALREWVSARDALPVLDGVPTGDTDADGLTWGTLSRRPRANGAVVVVLSAYRRCHHLAEQIASIKASVLGAAGWATLAAGGLPMPPGGPRNYSLSRIFVVHNLALCSVVEALAAHPDVHLIASPTWNTKFFGRYLPLLMREEQFALVLDDDMVLDPLALLNMLRAMAVHGDHAVVGMTGKRIRVAPGATRGLPGPQDIVYETQNCNCVDGRRTDSLVDFLNNAYMFPTVFARLMWAPGAWTSTLDNSDDMTMSMVARRYAAAPSVCAAMRSRSSCYVNYGSDEAAISATPDHWPVRRATLAYWYSRGYRGVCPRGPTGPGSGLFDARCLPDATPHRGGPAAAGA